MTKSFSWRQLCLFFELRLIVLFSKWLYLWTSAACTCGPALPVLVDQRCLYLWTSAACTCGPALPERRQEVGSLLRCARVFGFFKGLRGQMVGTFGTMTPWYDDPLVRRSPGSVLWFGYRRRVYKLCVIIVGAILVRCVT